MGYSLSLVINLKDWLDGKTTSFFRGKSLKYPLSALVALTVTYQNQFRRSYCKSRVRLGFLPFFCTTMMLIVCITFFLAAPFHLKRWQRPWLLGFSLYSLSFIPFAYNAVGVIEDVHGFWTKKILRPKTSTPFVHVFKVSIALIADSQFPMILNR